MSDDQGANRAAWARSIAGRHRRAGTQPRRAAMALVRPPSPSFHTTSRHEHRTTLVTHVHPGDHTVLERHVVGARVRRARPAAARIAPGATGTTIVTHSRAHHNDPATTVAATRPARVPTGRARGVVLAVPPAQSPATIGRRAHLEATVARIVRRYDRTEEGTRTTRVDRARVDVAAEVARVLTPPASFTDSDRPHHADVSSPASPGRASATLAPIDLDGLTDQIITRLDDRLIAHRERLGRAY